VHPGARCRGAAESRARGRPGGRDKARSGAQDRKRARKFGSRPRSQQKQRETPSTNARLFHFGIWGKAEDSVCCRMYCPVKLFRENCCNKLCSSSIFLCC